AWDPFRHWPIVLVGFLGKIFGPIGFVGAILQDRLPAAFGVTILTNDLIWWVPFGAILWQAFRDFSARQLQPTALPHPIQDLPGDTGKTLQEMSETGPVLVVLLRHAGCTFHREALADLEQARDALHQQGVQLAVVHMADGENPAERNRSYDLGDAVHFSDPSGSLYRAFGLQRGSLPQLLGPTVWWRGFQAFVRGHGVGCLTGDGFQMPGVFLLERGKITRSFKHKTAADRPDYVQLATG
ncbi:MAG: SelL-related redox protein, partial [Planctomycetota bacterium]